MTNELQASDPLGQRKLSFVRRSLPAMVIASLILGLTIGAVIRSMTASGWVGMIIDVFDVIGTMWVNAIRMTVIPLIVPLLIGSIAGAKSGRDAGRVGLTTIGAFVILVAILASTAALTAPLLFSGLNIDPAITSAMRASIAKTAVPIGDVSIGGWLKALIPTNPIKAAADGTMLSIIVFAAAFGFAALAAPEDLRLRVVQFTHTLSAIMLIIVQGVLVLAPIGIFALTLVVGARVGGAVFTAMGYLIGVRFVFATIFVVVLLVLTVLWGRILPGVVARGATPAMLVAAGTASSLSSLPVMIEGTRDVWMLPEKIYGFVLPLAVSTFKPSSAYSWVLTAYFIAKLYGIPFGPTQLALAAGYAVLFNATVPGIPNGLIIVISPMLLALGLPLEGLAIVMAVDPILDRFSTIGNVAADMSLTAIVSARTEGVTVSEDSCAAREVTTALPSCTAQGERQQFRDPGH